MFIAPDNVPAHLPPTSMQAVQAPGSVMSLQNPVSAMATTAGQGDVKWQVATSRHPAPPQPSIPSPRRTGRISPSRRLRIGDIQPATNEPLAPKNSGAT